MTAAHAVEPVAADAIRPRPLFATTLHAIDFSPASLAAARWASQHVARGSDAIVAHVAPMQESSADFGLRATRAIDSASELERSLTGALDGFAAMLASPSARTVLRGGRPSEWLTRVGSDAEASLVVVGRRADANRKRIGEPNVLERVARRTAASVLMVPEGVTEPPAFVLAAVDESAFCRDVLRAARYVASLHGCPLVVLHVLSPTEGAYDRLIGTRRNPRRMRSPWPAHDTPGLPPRLALHTSRWLVSLLDGRQSDGDAAVEIRIGDPAREISARALEGGSALVVVGHRGSDGAVRGSLGSVSRELLKRSPTPLLVVNPQGPTLP